MKSAEIIPFPTSIATLPDDASELDEARFQVRQLRIRRDGAPAGSRAQAVAQIKLDWWEEHLATLECRERLPAAELTPIFFAIEHWAGIIASRPHYGPERSTEILLAAPQCEHECAACYMGCAIAPARLKWWEDQLANVCGTSAMGSC